MKMSVLSPLLAAVLTAVATPWCQAQMVSVDDPNSALWDATTVQELKDVWLGYEDDESYVEIELQVNFTQSGSGKLAGAGTTEVWLDTTVGEDVFPAAYTVSGSISSSRGVAKVSRKVAASGTAMLDGAPRKAKMSDSNTVTINNATGVVTGKHAMKASASGVGSFSETETFTGQMPASAGDGSWMLEVSRAVSGTKVTGQAMLLPNAGSDLSFTVKGSYKAKTDTSSLSLTGTGAAKGASLKVTMVGHQITAVSGKVWGQSVNWKKVL